MNDTTASTAVGTSAGILAFLLILAVVGLLVGALARFLLPGRDDMSILKTMSYGIGGSFLGGLVSRFLGMTNQIINIVIAVALAMGLIWFFTRRK